MSTAAVNLVKEMVDMITFGEPSEAAALVVGAGAGLKRDALEYAQVLLYSFPPEDEVAAINQSISLLTAPPAQVAQVASSGGMSDTTKLALGAGGLLAVWYLFIRK